MAVDHIEISIDLEVYKAIEAKRSSFSQKPNDILRVVFGLLSGGAMDATTVQKHIQDRRITRKRSNGAYDFKLLGQAHHCASLKEAYLKCLTEMSRRDNQFLQKLSEVEVSTARRIIASTPEGLFLKSPHLAKDHAEKLIGIWWVDINISQQQVETRLKDASKLLGLKFGSDLLLEFPDET